MRKASETELHKTAFREMMKSVGTSIPGELLSFDPDTQLAQVRKSIAFFDYQGNRYEPSPIIEVPVFVLGSNDFYVEVELNPGTDGIIVFSQRCIDAWKDSGSVADNPIARFHDEHDAMFIPGLRPQVHRITGHSNNGIKLRNKSGSNYIWLKNDGTGEINLTTLTINANIVHNGDQSTSGTVTAPTVAATTSLTVAGKEMKQHNHSAGTYRDTDNNSAIVGNSGDPV